MTQIDRATELAGCPMCDAPARFVWSMRDETTGRVKCTRPSCGTQGGAFEHQSNAIAAWNRRALTQKDAEIARLRDRVATLVEALEPFAEVIEIHEEVGRANEDDDRINIVQAYGCHLVELDEDTFRRARAALSQEPTK